MLWQRHELPIETFIGMPQTLQYLYIASELQERKRPVKPEDIIIRMFSKKS